MKFMKLVVLAMASLCALAKAETTTYVSCGNDSGTYRLVVSSEAGYSTMQVFKYGEKTPSTNATAALQFRRCNQGPCKEEPTGIKSIDSKPSYNLSLPWQAMSSERFTAVLTEQTTGRLGEPVRKTFNITCQPGVKIHQLIASTRPNK